MEKVFVGVGSNLGDPAGNVQQAITRIDRTADISVLRSASLYGSKPFGPVPQDDFVNTVIELECSLEPADLLERLKDIERDMGRTQTERWGPREIDLDILIFGTRVLTSDALCLPHAGISERAFVLAPLAELEPGLRLTNGKSVEDAFKRLEQGLVWPLGEAATIRL